MTRRELLKMQLLSQKHELKPDHVYHRLETASVSFNQRVSTRKIKFNSVLSVIGLLVEIYKKKKF